ncbi:MAG: hypothetical protein LUE13_07635 [Akkermansiaceae bacterium]|nr:hypothetical protein [Akkermansiaceae bacterium]
MKMAGEQKEAPDYLEIYNYLSSRYDEIDGEAFYRYIFPVTEKSTERHEDFSHPHALYLYRDERDMDAAAEDEQQKTGHRRLRRRIIYSDTWAADYQEYVEQNPLTLCSGLMYRKRANTLENAQQANALIFDLDEVGVEELQNIFALFEFPPERIRSIPVPTFIVMSGRGLHLYYVFDQPVALYPNIKVQMKQLKYDLTYRFWNPKVTSRSKQIQYQSISQGFRMPGSINEKYGVEVLAFQSAGRISLATLNKYADHPEDQVDVLRPFQPSRMTREQAREAYPEWYERVVVKGQKAAKKWDIRSKQGFALYDWWRGHLHDIQGGHRYYYLMCLAIYACKCDVPRDKLLADMQEDFDYLKKHVSHTNEMTGEEIHSAMEMYSKEYYNFKIEDIELLTNIRIERNRRNYNNQKDHLEEARGIRDIRMRRQNKDWRDGNGRPAKDQLIHEYRAAHPEASVSEVAKALGISRPTVYKWWNPEVTAAQLRADRERQRQDEQKNAKTLNDVIVVPGMPNAPDEMKPEDMQKMMEFIAKHTQSTGWLADLYEQAKADALKKEQEKKNK